MDQVARVVDIVTPSLEAMGYELVRAHLVGGPRPTLQIMADRADGKPMSVEDCADISRAVSAILDVEDPIPTAYVLEVSSPGIDRPLTRRKDFEVWAGFEAKLESRVAVDGRKRFRGKLLGVDGDEIKVLVEGAEMRVPFDAVQRAKLVLTDELLAAAAAQQAEAQSTEPDGEAGDSESAP